VQSKPAHHRPVLLRGWVTPELACPAGAGWKDVAVPKAYPREFGDDVVRVARSRDDGMRIEQIAADFGIHPMTLSKWMRQADVDEGTKAGTSTIDSTELREARRRSKLLEQENEVLRRAAAYLSQSNLSGKGFTRS
jgi:transposase